MESKYSLITIFDIDYFSKDFLEESLGLDNIRRLLHRKDYLVQMIIELILDLISNIYSNILKIFFWYKLI